MDSIMAAEMANISIAQHESPQTWPFDPAGFHNSLLSFLMGWSVWQYMLTFILTVVLYDQGKAETPRH